MFPIPTSPALLFLMINHGVFDFTIIYILSSSLACSLFYVSGIYFEKFKFIKARIRLLRYWIKNKIPIQKLNSKYLKKAADLSKIQNLIGKMGFFDIAVARFLGLHNHIIMFSFGYYNVGPTNGFLVNTAFCLIDILFYWSIIGGGKILLGEMFPSIDFEALISTDLLFEYMLACTIIIYILYFFYRIVRLKKINS